MQDKQEIRNLAQAVQELFADKLGEFREEDFKAVAWELGFYAYSKSGPHEQGKIMGLGDNNLPDIIGTNLQHALDYYEWRDQVPMTEDGMIVSGFWDSSREPMPEEYELIMEGKALVKRG